MAYTCHGGVMEFIFPHSYRSWYHFLSTHPSICGIYRESPKMEKYAIKWKSNQ